MSRIQFFRVFRAIAQAAGFPIERQHPHCLKKVALHPHARRQHQSHPMYVTEPLYTERAYVVVLNRNETVEKVGFGSGFICGDYPLLCRGVLEDRLVWYGSDDRIY